MKRAGAEVVRDPTPLKDYRHLPLKARPSDFMQTLLMMSKFGGTVICRSIRTRVCLVNQLDSCWLPLRAIQAVYASGPSSRREDGDGSSAIALAADKNGCIRVLASGATGIGNLPPENRYQPVSPPLNYARHRSEPESDSGHSLPYSMLRRCHSVGWMFLLRRNKFVGSYLFFSATSRSYLSAP